MSIAADLLKGWVEIADCIGMEPADARYLEKVSDMPVFKIGRNWFARRSDLDAWFRPRAHPRAADDQGPAGTGRQNEQAAP